MRLNHIFVSITQNYPHSYNAANTKFGFLGKGFLEMGDEVLFINKFYRSGIRREENGDKEGIKYISLPDKRFGMFFNSLKVCALLKDSYIKDSQNVVYLGGGHFAILLLLTIYARIIGYRVALVWDEYQVGLDFSLVYKINGFFLCYILGYFVNYILPISEFLIEKSKKFHKPIFKLPICADFKSSKHNDISPIIQEELYFLYCASVEYGRALSFVLDSYMCLLKEFPYISLHLILSGNNEKIAAFRSVLKEKGLDDKVIVMTQLSYDRLLEQYGNAQGLLIPLFNDRLGDIARFSQKISEYLTSMRPVITINVGEIAYYFRHMETMLISKSSSPYEYARLMSYVIDNPDEAALIGKRGFVFGMENFDYKIVSKNLSCFLEQECKRNILLH